jgi:hypothetical protein
MREDDDAQQGSGEGSLADGLGETETEYSSSSEPFGDGGFDGSYDDSYDDDSSTDSSETDSSSTESPADESDGSVVIYDETDDAGSDEPGAAEPDDGDDAGPSDDAADGSYGDGDADGDVVIYESDEPVGDDTEQPSDDAADDGTSLDDGDLLSEDASPLEGIGYLLDQVRDALLGEGDEDASGTFDVDPAELTSDTDLDLTGDGVVDGADLHEAASSLDFHVDGGHAGGHDGGVFDA